MPSMASSASSPLRSHRPASFSNQVTFTAYGPMRQAGGDEGYGVDNVTLTDTTSMTAVPEPGLLALVSAALRSLAAADPRARRTCH